MKGIFRRVFCGLVCVFGVSSASFAQFSGALQGTVEDSSGASVPSATITLTNT